jgi:myosin heavy subunit
MQSRAVNQAKAERNYHIFYNLLAGATDAERTEFYLTRAQDYHYLNQSGCIKLDNINDAESMQRIRQAMRILTFKDSDSIFRAIAAILHIGNIDFKPMPGDSVSVIDKNGTFCFQYLR